jgi:hypothetical protein
VQHQYAGVPPITASPVAVQRGATH